MTYCTTCERPAEDCTQGVTIVEDYGPLSGPVERGTDNEQHHWEEIDDTDT